VKHNALPEFDFLKKDPLLGSCGSWQDAHSTFPLNNFTSLQPFCKSGGILKAGSCAAVGYVIEIGWSLLKSAPIGMMGFKLLVWHLLQSGTISDTPEPGPFLTA
jgi:hypothetical protein